MFVLYLTYYSLLNYKVTFRTDINCFWEFSYYAISAHRSFKFQFNSKLFIDNNINIH